MTSILSAFPFIGEQSFATPGAFNSPLSILSANIAAINADVGAFSGVTITPPSGNTITIASNLSVTGQLQSGPIHTDGPVRIDVNSNLTNYLYLSDASNLRSDYIIGSQVGGTADGLNIWDDSGQTMIVSFSKQSIRFYQNIVGPVFDIGGALSDTLNAATFGTGADSMESRIQAAISAATQAGIRRVYLPHSMLPYRAASISFDTRALMVREGGAATGFDAKAYGAQGSGASDDTPSLQICLTHAFQTNGEVFIPLGVYRTTSSLTLPPSTAGSISIRGEGVSQRLTGGVSGDPIGNYGSRISYTGTTGDVFFSQVTTPNTRQYVRIEKVYLQGNVAGGTTGHGIHLKCNHTLSGIFFTIRDLVVNGAKEHGLFLNGNIFESGIHDSIFAQCGDRGIMASAGTGGVGSTAPTQIHHDRVTCVLNNVGLDFSGGGNFTSSELALLNSTLVGLQANGGNAYCLGTTLESNGSVFARLQAMQKSFFGGVSINYASSSTATGFHFDGSCVANTIVGLAPNSGAGNTDFVIMAGAADNTIVNYYGAGFVHRYIDQGVRTCVLTGSYQSNQVVGRGTSIAPTFADLSEVSLGWYRSGVSALGLSYGQLQLPAGTATQPSLAISSESSLGLYCSAASTLAVSYGTFLVSSTVSFPASSIVRFPNGQAFCRTGANGSDVYLDVGTLHIRDGLQGDVSTGGRLQLNDGAATTPTLVFNSENTLGFYRSGTNTIAQSLGTFDLTAVIASMGTIRVKSGANNSCGTAVLGSNGSVNVANTYVKTGDLIFLTDVSPAGTIGSLEMTGIRNSSGFTITSTNVLDTSTVAWLIIRPG